MPETLYNVMVQSLPDELSREQVSQYLQKGLGMAESAVRGLLAELPAAVCEGVDEEEAAQAKQRLEWCGAQVLVQPTADEAPEPVPAPPPPPAAPKILPGVQPPPRKPVSRTELGVASPSESRVERMLKTIAREREESEQDDAPFISPQAPPRLPTDSPGKKLGIALVTSALAVVLIILFVNRGGRKPDSGQPADMAPTQTQMPTEGSDTAKTPDTGSQAKPAEPIIEVDVPDTKQYEDFMRAGRDAEKAGRYLDALSAYRRAVGINDTTEARQAAGRVVAAAATQDTATQRVKRLADLQRSIPALKAKQEWDKLKAALLEMKQIQGDAFTMAGELKLASLYAEQIRLERRHRELQAGEAAKAREWVAKARSFLDRGMTPEAAEAAHYALIMEPNNPEAKSLLAQCEAGGAAPPQPAPVAPSPALRPSKPVPQPAPVVEEAKPKPADTQAKSLIDAAVVPAAPPKPKPAPTPVAKPKAAPPKPVPPAPVKARQFWPLSVGDTWRYRSLTTPGMEILRTITGTQVIDGKVYFRCEEAHAGSGAGAERVVYLVLRKTGLYEADDDGKETKRYELPMAVGQAFSYRTQAGATPELFIQPAVVEIKTLRKERVETPAGVFDCFVVERRSRQKQFVRKTAQLLIIEEVATQWVCGGVGLVKEERIRRTTIASTQTKEARDAIELTSYQIKTD